ncbi:MAG: diguanylate cyclase [Cyanobacteria bacterium SBC]|nr:diguanylate cyclase [Cyanobacteria bacterium SBC]
MNLVDARQTSQTELRGNILVVDDAPANLVLLRQILCARGYRVRVSRTGEFALKSTFAQQPDLILLDIKMPDMDGYAVCRALKADRRTCNIPVIFLSVVESANEKVEAFRLGGADYITKPFQTEEVLVRVEHQLLVQRQKIQLEREILERQRAETVLRESQSLLWGVLNSSLDGVAAFRAVRDRSQQIVDFQGLVANPAAAKMVGEASEGLVGQRLLDVWPEARKLEVFDDFVAVVETGNLLDREVYCTSGHFSGWLQLVAVKLEDGLTVTFRDVTERKQMELALKAANVELQQQAYLDGLTQLANRRRFDEYFQDAWDRCTCSGQSLSLILCDVDRFKAYNDTYGHQAGDRCLQQIAVTLRSASNRPADLVARYGGEEFAVVLPDTEASGAIRVAKRLRDVVRQLKLPHATSGVREIVTLSVGISSCMPCQDRKTLPKDLVRAADLALYRAKEEGRDRACWQMVRIRSSEVEFPSIEHSER